MAWAQTCTRDLLVSLQHCILVRSITAKRMFDRPEVLIAAKKLVGLPGIGTDTRARFVTYWHLLFDRHEVIF